ncbi:MAG: helix-turn-helix domain-containing protein [Bryobacteraceae bacterium]|jgi:AraC family transcriptional regulator
MTTPLKQVQPVIAFAAAHLDEDLSLEALADQAGLSAFHLHRVFSAAAGETPKQFTLRLRLARASAMLLTTADSVLDIALECGFQSHEAFCRAFRRRFGMTPSVYRTRGFAGGIEADEAMEHAGIVDRVAPCIGLFHHHRDGGSQTNNMAYSITKKEIPAQPVLVVRRRVKPSEVASTLAEVLGYVFTHAQQNGIALAGQPLTRYVEWGPGLWTIEAGMPVTAHCCESPVEAEVRTGTLPGGLVATTTHTGSYDKLNEAHAAVQQWMEAEGLTAAGAPWESYTTDPADYPDPKDWKTDIFWPVASPKAPRSDVATKPVVYQMPGMDAVLIQRDIPYQTIDASNLTMDVYRPPNSNAATRLPAVVFVIGYSDLGAERTLGCKFKEMESYITWAKLVAASGLIAITYVNHEPLRDLDALFRHLRENAEALGIDEHRMGVWSCSGNVPRALGLLMQKEDLKCAALCYGVTLDVDGFTGVAEAAKTWRFANPTAGKSVRDLPPDVPLFIARGGRDEMPRLNEALDRFIADALAANLPITIANHATGPHAFDLMHDSDTSREIVRQILAFLRFHLLG